MGYGELVQAASELRNMTRNEDGLDLWNIDDARDWAQFLYDWADSTATDDKVAPLKKAG